MDFLRSLLKRLRRRENTDVINGTVRPLVNLAFSLLQRSDYIGARKLLVKALQYGNRINDPALLLWISSALALTWDHSEEYRERTQFYSDYIARFPEDAIAYTMRGGSLWYSGELRRAIADYSRALELDPKDCLALSGRGQVFVESGEPRKAIDDLDLALENLEHSPITDLAWRTAARAYILNGRAAAYAALGEFDRALNEFENSISLCPQNAWVYFNRAEAYEGRADKLNAIENYKLALAMNDPKLNTLKRQYAQTKLKLLTE